MELRLMYNDWQQVVNQVEKKTFTVAQCVDVSPYSQYDLQQIKEREPEVKKTAQFPLYPERT